MKVALVCDWLEGIGGGERVVLAMHKMYPDAPIYTSQYNSDNLPMFKDADVRTTWLQKLPTKLKKFLPPLRAYVFSRLDLSDYDLVISISGAEAKGVKTGPKTTHICYCHSPTQYYWIRQEEYLKQPGFPFGFNWLARVSLKILESPLKRWDKHAAKQPDYIIANSTYTKDNIKRYYKRDSVVICPPVDVERFRLSKPVPRHGLVIAGRQTPYKRIDLAIESANKLKLPLIVIGNGPDHKRLEKIADRNVTFLTNVNDLVIVEHFQTSLLFLFPNADDFGIVAVEALSAGTPVVAYKKGGALDYIKEGKNGIFFDKQTVPVMAKAIEKALKKKFNYEEISRSTSIYSEDRFKKEVKKYIKRVTEK